MSSTSSLSLGALVEAIAQGKQCVSTHDCDIVALFGGTGSGKTSLMYRFLGKKFKVRLDSNQEYHMEPVELVPEMPVGDGLVAATTSVTLVPVTTSSGSTLYLCDMPGQRDAGGVFNEVKFAVMNARALSKAKSVRTVVVWPSEITACERGNRVIPLLAELAGMFKNWESVKGSIAFCMSKMAEPREFADGKSVDYETMIERAVEDLTQLATSRESSDSGTLGYAVLRILEDSVGELQDMFESRDVSSNAYQLRGTRLFISNPMDDALSPQELISIVEALPPLHGTDFAMKLSNAAATTVIETLRDEVDHIQAQFERGGTQGPAENTNRVLECLDVLQEEQLIDDSSLSRLRSELISWLCSLNAQIHSSLVLAAARCNCSEIGMNLSKLRHMDDFFQSLSQSAKDALIRTSSEKWCSFNSFAEQVSEDFVNSAPSLPTLNLDQEDVILTFAMKLHDHWIPLSVEMGYPLKTSVAEYISKFTDVIVDCLIQVPWQSTPVAALPETTVRYARLVEVLRQLENHLPEDNTSIEEGRAWRASVEEALLRLLDSLAKECQKLQLELKSPQAREDFGLKLKLIAALCDGPEEFRRLISASSDSVDSSEALRKRYLEPNLPSAHQQDAAPVIAAMEEGFDDDEYDDGRTIDAEVSLVALGRNIGRLLVQREVASVAEQEDVQGTIRNCLRRLKGELKSVLRTFSKGLDDVEADVRKILAERDTVESQHMSSMQRQQSDPLEKILPTHAKVDSVVNTLPWKHLFEALEVQSRLGVECPTLNDRKTVFESTQALVQRANLLVHQLGSVGVCDRVAKNQWVTALRLLDVVCHRFPIPSDQMTKVAELPLEFKVLIDEFVSKSAESTENAIKAMQTSLEKFEFNTDFASTAWIEPFETFYERLILLRNSEPTANLCDLPRERLIASLQSWVKEWSSRQQQLFAEVETSAIGELSHLVRQYVQVVCVVGDVFATSTLAALCDWPPTYHDHLTSLLQHCVSESSYADPTLRGSGGGSRLRVLCEAVCESSMQDNCIHNVCLQLLPKIRGCLQDAKDWESKQLNRFTAAIKHGSQEFNVAVEILESLRLPTPHGVELEQKLQTALLRSIEAALKDLSLALNELSSRHAEDELPKHVKIVRDLCSKNVLAVATKDASLSHKLSELKLEIEKKEGATRKECCDAMLENPANCPSIVRRLRHLEKLLAAGAMGSTAGTGTSGAVASFIERVSSIDGAAGATAQLEATCVAAHRVKLCTRYLADSEVSEELNHFHVELCERVDKIGEAFLKQLEAEKRKRNVRVELDRFDDILNRHSQVCGRLSSAPRNRLVNSIESKGGASYNIIRAALEHSQFTGVFERLNDLDADQQDEVLDKVDSIIQLALSTRGQGATGDDDESALLRDFLAKSSSVRGLNPKLDSLRLSVEAAITPSFANRAVVNSRWLVKTSPTTVAVTGTIVLLFLSALIDYDLALVATFMLLAIWAMLYFNRAIDRALQHHIGLSLRTFCAASAASVALLLHMEGDFGMLFLVAVCLVLCFVAWIRYRQRAGRPVLWQPYAAGAALSGFLLATQEFDIAIVGSVVLAALTLLVAKAFRSR